MLRRRRKPARATRISGTSEICKSIDGKKYLNVTEFAQAVVKSSVNYLKDMFPDGDPEAKKCFPTEVAEEEAQGDNNNLPGQEMPEGFSFVEEAFMEPDDHLEGNWSEQEIPETHRESILRKVPKETRREVRRTHNGLGHPSRATLLRMMKLGNATPAAIEYAKIWICPICAASARPHKPLEASTRLRPFGFNVSVGCDLKYLSDAEQKNHVILSMVDAGTSWHVAIRLKNRTPQHVISRIIDGWIGHYGCPREFIIDQGGEFMAEFTMACEEYGLDTRCVGSHAPWQHGLTERHGAILGEIWAKMVYQFGIKGSKDTKRAIAICCQAKNATMTRNGISPEQAVFGRPLRWTESSNKDDEEIMMSALGADGEAWKSAQIRSAARISLINRDASDKIRRALMRQAPRVIHDLCPGTRVYFWSPHPFKGRYRSDALRWRGPATVIDKESRGRYYISWRARVLLVSKDQLRYASTEEAAAADSIAKNATLTANQSDDKKSYVDLTNPDKMPPKGKVIKHRIKVKARPLAIKAPRDRRKEIAGALAEAVAASQATATEPVVAPERAEPASSPLALGPEADAASGNASVGRSSGDQVPMAVEDVQNPVEVAAGDDDADLTELAEGERKRNISQIRAQALDDVPLSIKRTKYQESLAGVEHLPQLAMLCVVEAPKKSQWFDKDELAGVSTLMDKVVTGVRVHSTPRQHLFEHARFKNCNRLSVMLTESGAANLADNEAQRSRKKMPSHWVGLTFFYHDKPSEDDPIGVYYLDTPEGLLPTPLTYEEQQNVSEVFRTWRCEKNPHEVYLLKMKKGMKELDPKLFNHKERAAFDASDHDEWKQWLLNKTASVVPEKDEPHVPKDKIISAPMRYVRTNRSKILEILAAKSRLILLGHLDPQIGLYRTDAPTTSALAVYVAAAIAMAYGWIGEVFDVMTAFLTGKELTREVYARAPREGLPATKGQPRVKPYALLRIWKGAYGLTDAPRQWYLQAREIMGIIGFIELKCARAVFILRDALHVLVAVVTLHVDDGLLFGNRQNRTFQKARAQLDQRFNIKKWESLNPDTDVDYLGMQWRQYETCIIVHMDTYIDKLELVPVPNNVSDDTLLTHVQRHDYKVGLGQIRWPVSHISVEHSYSVSSVAQHGPDSLRVEHLKELNVIIKGLRQARADGRARMKFHKIKLDDLVVVTPFDASFGKENGLKSQAGFMSLLSDKSILKKPALCSLVEFHSGTISRVVKSTMAAESASLSIALDRHLYLRLLVESMLYGEPEYGHDWRMKLKIPGVLITDAKSLFDHLGKTGSMPKERQTLIDLLTARDLVENHAVDLRWMPTTHMLADILTKKMPITEIIKKALCDGWFSVVPTEKEEALETHRKTLRQNQRQRRKLRLKAEKKTT